MSGLRQRGLEEAVKEIVKRDMPLLGICVGMQALFEVGEEMGEHKGLGLLSGRVARFAESLSVKIPHTGWNRLEVQNDAFLFNEINSGAYVYFNHSYYCQAKKFIRCDRQGPSMAFHMPVRCSTKIFLACSFTPKKARRWVCRS